MNEIPCVALLSGRLTSSEREAHSEPYSQLDCSNLLWSLWRLGVRRVIALEADVTALVQASRALHPPPPLPDYQAPLLRGLIERHQRELTLAPLSHLAWSERLEISPLPSEPLDLSGVQLCFHDELIGVRDALLIHYGPSRFEVSGYHPPISSLSVPLGDELSALVLFRLPAPRDSRGEGSRGERSGEMTTQTPRGRSSSTPSLDEQLLELAVADLETSVSHLSARGELIKGPWWPRLKN